MGKEQAIETMKSEKTLKTAREAGYFGKKMLKEAIRAQQEGLPSGGPW